MITAEILSTSDLSFRFSFLIPDRKITSFAFAEVNDSSCKIICFSGNALSNFFLSCFISPSKNTGAPSACRG